MARETRLKSTVKTTKNGNLGSFVDVVTPDPVVIDENYICFATLTTIRTGLKNDKEKEYLDQLVEIVLSINKQEQFLTLGERIAVNTLKKMKILG